MAETVLPPDGREILALRDVSYTFADNRVHALQNLSLEFRTGELCFLLGENGAGKSTLARLAAGFLRPKKGYLMLHGKPYVPRSPRIALRKGVALIPQHPDVVGRLKVWENLALAGHVPGVHGPFRLLRPRTLITRYESLLRTFGLTIDLEARASTLSAAEIHWLALAEALVRRPRFLFLDEPSAPYTQEEVKRLYGLLKNACKLGMGVIVISHRLEEIQAYGDRVMVLKHGRVTLDKPIQGCDDLCVQGAMFNEPEADTERNEPGPVRGEQDFLASPLPRPLVFDSGIELVNCSALDVRNLSGRVLKRIAFTLNSGEILGIHSPMGKSSEMLEDILTCMKPSPRGCLTLNGQPWPRTPRKLRSLGVRYIPSRRFRRGIAEDRDIVDNIVGFRRISTYQGGFWNQKGFMSFARYLPFTIPRKWSAPITTLSGGTIQRVILNRELGEPSPRLILCFEPSWGLDKRLQDQMHEHLKTLASRGSAILYLSSDHDEVKRIAGRMLELKNGYLREVHQ